MTATRVLIAAATLLAAKSLQAQESCVGPGLAYGVTAYQCTSCGMKREAARYMWTFGAEPVVTEVTEWSVLRPGDVIQAVNDRLITTAEGAREFAFPPMVVSLQSARLGDITLRGTANRVTGTDVTIRVRRNGESIVLAARGRCDAPMRWFTRDGDTLLMSGGYRGEGGARGGGGGARGGGVGRGGGSASGTVEFTPALIDSMSVAVRRGRGGGGRGTSDSTRRVDPALVARMIEQMDELRRSLERTGRFGIALSCAPSCAKLRIDGLDYWKYDAPPTIAEVRRQSPAERVGLLVGDLVLAIDGYAITSDEGAQRFARSASDSTSMQLTIRRNGQEMRFDLTASPQRGGGRGGARGGRAGPPN